MGNKDKGFSYFVSHTKRKRTNLFIPEINSLFICPAACGRRKGIRAAANGVDDRMAFLYITEADVSGGYYENLVGDAIEEIIEVTEKKPRGFNIVVHCIDDFLGTDEKALLENLRERFPDLRFLLSRINPVSADCNELAEGAKMHTHLYSFLSYTGVKDNGVNFSGLFVPPDDDCELYEVFKSWGVSEVRQITTCKNFDDYLKMADSSFNFVFMNNGRYCGDYIAEHLQIPYMYIPCEYDMEQIDRVYDEISQMVGQPLPDLSYYRNKALEEVEKTKAILGDRPLVVESSASYHPFALAKALLKYGFNVCSIMAFHWKGNDSSSRKWIEEHYPKIKIFEKDGHEAVMDYGFDDDIIVIGYDGGAILRATYLCDIQHDEGLWGYYGVGKLMEALRSAVETRRVWE